MSTNEDLIQQLNTASGESLYGAIRELGKRGVEARDAVHPLLKVIRHHEDRAARGHALMAVGLIDPTLGDAAMTLDKVKDVQEEAREAAHRLNEEAARLLLSLILESPVGWLTEAGFKDNLPEVRAIWKAPVTLQALYMDDHDRPLMCRSVWSQQLARRFPALIPDLVEALADDSTLSDELPSILAQLGGDHPEVVQLLMPLFDHESREVRNKAIYACATTRRMPTDALPRLMDALREDENDGRLECSLSYMADLHPREVMENLSEKLGVHGLWLLARTNPSVPEVQAKLDQELVLYLFSPEADTRLEAARSLGVSGRRVMSAEATKAIPRLKELLNDDDPRVRSMAGGAINEIEKKKDISR